MRGKNFLDGWTSQDRTHIQENLAAICRQGAAGVLELEGSSDSRHRVELEAILLPLTHTDNQITRIIGAMSMGPAPYWLESEPLRSRRLLRHELIWPDGRPHSVVERLGERSPFLARAQLRSVKIARTNLRVFQGGLSDIKRKD